MNAQPIDPLRALPANTEAEAALLGAALIDNRVLVDLPVNLTPAHFFEPIHARIYDRILTHRALGKAVTSITLRPDFEADEGLKELGGPTYLARLTADGQGLLAPRELAEQIYDLALLRELVSVGRNLVEGAMNTSEDIAPDALLAQTQSALADVSASAAHSAKRNPPLGATPYSWPDPATLPTRQWLLGHWLLRGEITAIIAPGDTGKSTISGTMALCLASGRPLLGKPLPRGPQAVWIFNLEDGTDELDRQMAAACAFHDIGPEDCGDRLYLDSGLVQPLCTANENQEGFALAEEVFVQLAATIRDRHIATVIVDPFVSSHAVQENNNGAIDAIAKRWKRLAQETGCAVVLVHHTKKLGGREVTAEDGRGAVALRDAARVVLPLNPMSQVEAEELGIADPALRRSLVRIDTGKANRAPPDAATWIKLEGQSLENGSELEPPDFVGVATLWEKPDVFQGLTTWHLYMVQQGLAAGDWRESVQAKDWVGHLIAKVAGLSAETDKGRIKAILRTWRKNGALAVEHRTVNGRDVPFVIVGKPVEPSEIGTRPHLQTCGAESAEDDPC